jgi:hypothetical protein
MKVFRKIRERLLNENKITRYLIYGTAITGVDAEEFIDILRHEF